MADDSRVGAVIVLALVGGLAGVFLLLGRKAPAESYVPPSPPPGPVIPSGTHPQMTNLQVGYRITP